MDTRKQVDEHGEKTVDLTPEAILVINAEGLIHHANHEVELMFGYNLEELVGKPVEMLIPDHFRTAHVQHRLNFHQSPSARPIGSDQALAGRRKDGSLFQVEVALYPVASEEGPRVVASVRDVSRRVRQEQALHEGEARYQNLVDSLPEVIYRVTGDALHGEVDYVSEQVERILGYTPADFYRDPHLFLRIIHPDDVALVQSQVQQLIEGADYCTRSYRIRRGDNGEYRHLEDVVVARRDEDGQLIGLEGAARDVTERMLRVQELWEQQSLSQAMVESALESIAVTDEGRALFVNKAFLKLHGLTSEEEALHSPPLAWILPADRGIIKARQDARRRGEPTGDFVEYRILRPSGEVRWVQASGVPMHYLGRPARLSIIRDVTEMKQAEEALAESEEQYRAVVENASEGITISVNGLRMYANSAFLKLVGASHLSQVVNQPIDALYIDDERPAILIRHLARLQGRQFAEPFSELHLRRLDGQIRTVQTSNVAIRYKGKQAVMGVVRDVTEQRAMEDNLRATNLRLQETLQQLREAQAQSVRQERLNALGVMASGIAHDFNNALTPILGFTALILERPDVAENKVQLLRYIRDCHTAAENAVDIVARLREFYRRGNEPEAFTLLDLNVLVRETADLTRYVWQEKANADGKAITLGLELSPGARVMGNSTELKEVLTNLIINAVDAIPHAGAIKIRTSTAAGAVRMEVQDTGTGMSPEVMEHCFDPFFTTKGEKGTGMGLAVTYGVIQRHGGRIDVQSALGKGTTFVILLPVGSSRGIVPIAMQSGRAAG